MKRIFVLVSFVILLTGCGLKEEGKDAVDYSEEDIYNAACLSCHGELKADPNAPLSINGIGKHKTEEEIKGLIVKPPEGMPGELVSEEVAEKLAKWISNETKKD